MTSLETSKKRHFTKYYGKQNVLKNTFLKKIFHRTYQNNISHISSESTVTYQKILVREYSNATTFQKQKQRLCEYTSRNLTDLYCEKTFNTKSLFSILKKSLTFFCHTVCVLITHL